MTPQRFQGITIGVLLAALLLVVTVGLLIIGARH
jgi:tetrahydromethanopterin S-methyltransferase subunit F